MSLMLGARLEVEMSKRHLWLWCQAYFAVKTYKVHHSRETFWMGGDVQKVHAAVTRSAFRSETEEKNQAQSSSGSRDEKLHAVVAAG